jgi:peptidoglycan hydrolase CwlO-like protein
MKLIFKIYKKVRELKREERELKQNIERYKLDISTLKEQSRKGLINYQCLQDSGFAKEVYRRVEGRETHIKFEEQRLNKKEKQLNKREQELNELQQKINDQILKLGIVKGVNNE